MAGADRDDLVERVQQGLALAQAVQRADLDQALQGALAGGAQVHTVGEVGQIAEGAALGARLQDQVHRGLADVFDGSQAKTDGGFAFRAVFDGEIPAAGVDVRRQHIHTRGAAVRHVKSHLGGIVFRGRKQGGHEFDRVMALQVAGLDGDHAVIGGMALVKAILGEFFPIGEDAFGFFRRNAALAGAFDKLVAVLDQFIFLLLRDDLAQFVGFGQGVAAQVDRRAHDLFLVDGDAVGFFKNRLEAGVRIRDRLDAVHAVDVAGDELQRAGAVERHHSDDVSQVLRLHLHDVAGHAGAFQLEDACGMPAAQELEGLGVVDGDVVQGESLAVALLDQVAGALHDGEGGQAQEVHLEQAERLDDRHFKLRHRLDGRLFRAAGWAVQGSVVDQRHVGDEHARGVRAGVAHHAFHVGGGVDHLAQVFGVIVNFLKLWHLLQRVADGDGVGGHLRDQLGDAVDLGEGDIHHAAYVADGGARAERAKGDDLGDLVAAVFDGAVFHDLGAAVILEVQVDIRHGDAPRVEEALEEQVLLDRLDQGDIQRVAHQ